MRVLIVDDERIARLKVRSALEAIGGIATIAQCADGADAVELLQSNAFDLVFLDVQLPELSGFEVVRAIGAANMPAVVFVTAYDQYAIAAFDVEALDYLVKPFDDERLRQAFERAQRRLELRDRAGITASFEGLLRHVGPAEPVDRLAVPLKGRTLFVSVEDIDYVEADDNYVWLHIGSRSHLVRGKISALEARLDALRFVRTHRSTIVNLDRVVELRATARGEVVVLRDGKRLPVGATRRETVQQRLGTRLAPARESRRVPR